MKGGREEGRKGGREEGKGEGREGRRGEEGRKSGLWFSGKEDVKR